MNHWLTRNIVALGIASLFSDFSHEMTTVVLPSFLISIGGSAALLGIIEGFADAAISFMKFFAGKYSDILGRRKPFAVVGYALTGLGVAILAVSYSWYQVLIGRVVSWSGKGLRKPPRDALLVESTQPQFYGRVFGFHRMMDTIGGIVGPLAAYFLVSYVSYRMIFVIALIPSILAVIVIALVKEIPGKIQDRLRLPTHISHLPHNFRMFLYASTLFALGKFADSMLILRVTQLLTPSYGMGSAARTAIVLYTLRNCFYAFGAYPFGVLADRVGKRFVLVGGYCITACVSLGLGFFDTPVALIALCMLAGISLAITDATEKSVAADYIPGHMLATGYGILAFAGGIAAFFSSSIIGIMWSSISPLVAFIYSACLIIAAAILLLFTIKDARHS